MFTIEHEFESTVITILDEPGDDPRDDVVLRAFEDRVTIEQLDPNSGKVRNITLSVSQVGDLAAAIDLPEGVYRLARK